MDVKSFFHAWCNKNSKSFNFDVRPVGMKHKQRFLCELSVDGYPYKGWGNSTNKKDSQFNAARDFLQYLVRQNVLSPSEVPTDTFGRPPGPQEEDVKDEADSVPQRNPVFEPGMTPQSMGEAYRPYKKGDDSSTYTYIDRLAEARKNGEEVVVDMNAAIHGNWTLENGKSRLHQFLQQHNIKADYTYSVSGAQHNRCFVAEMSIWVKSLNRTLTGRESASSKAAASKSCALSLVRQLYHLGVIEGYSTTVKKKSKVPEVDPYTVAVDPSLEEKIYDVLKELNIKPTEIPNEELPEDQAVSIINSSVLEEFLTTKAQPAGVISWAPPFNNWNAWTACNIDEGPLASATLDEISEELEKSRRLQLQEDENLQNLLKDRDSLPVAAMKTTIMQSISDNPVIIVRGNTGCGKTTQICQFILDDHIHSGQGAYCNIVVTQPRRISAVSVADRVAFERSEPLGDSVGYSVRFESCSPRPFGSIMFCTVGVLLRKLENGLKGVSHVIVDEIHERDVNTDFILVVLRDMVHTYPDLRVILMSATIDTTLFSKYFGNCPVVEIPGRSYPVQSFFLEDCIEMTKFKPPVDGKKKKRKHDDDDDEVAHAMDELEENLNKVISDQYSPEVKMAMAQLNERELCFELFEELLKYIKGLNIPGAVLIFLPGWTHIFVLMRHLLNNSFFRNPDFVILPLHSQLPREDQRRVFDTYPPNVTKVILATNIAETSITINDVVFVIDSCKAKVKTFTTHNNITQYNTVWASKSNLEQRKGRAGRVQPGMCFFLVSKARYEKLDEHITPEMLRTPLHELGLAIKVLRLGAIGQFLSKAIQPPPIDTVVEAEVLLREMKCLDSNDELTPLGRILGRLPIDPRLGKMLILGCIFHCGDALTTITASSSTMPEVFLTYPERKRLTFQQKAFSGNRFSDHVAILNVFQAWQMAADEGENSEEMFCESKMVSKPGMKIISEAKHQLVDILTGVTGFPEETVAPVNFNYLGADDNLDLVIGLLCMGLYPNIAYHVARRKVITAGSKYALISKTSVNCTNQEFVSPIPFFVFGEKIRTKAISCKQLTMVTPIHLLLFGTRTVEYVNKTIKLDGWLTLDMKPELASAIVALRPAIESLIIKAAKDPSQVSENSLVDNKVIYVVTELCKLNAGRYNLEPVNTPQHRPRPYMKNRTQEFGRSSPPAKLPYIPNNRGRGLGHGYGGGYRGGYNSSRGRGGWFGGYGGNYRGGGSVGGRMSSGMGGSMNRGMEGDMSGSMDRSVGDRMGGSMDRGMGDRMSVGVGRSTNRGMCEGTGGNMNRDMGGRMSGGMGERMSGSMDRSMNRDTGVGRSRWGSNNSRQSWR